MLRPYIAYGFTFYENSEGLIYVSNIQDMISLYGVKMVDDCINACEFYNSVKKQIPTRKNKSGKKMNLSILLADLKEGDYVHIKLNDELGTEWAGEISTVANDGIWIDDNLSEHFEFVSYADLKDWERKDILEFAVL